MTTATETSHASAEQQRARLEDMKVDHAALKRELARFTLQALALGEKPDAAAIEREFNRFKLLEYQISVAEPHVRTLEHRAAQNDRWAADARQERLERERERQDKEDAEKALAWLDRTMGATGVQGIRKREALDRAEADGIERGALQRALAALEVREVDGAYLYGTASPERGVAYWRVGPAPRDRPAQVA